MIEKRAIETAVPAMVGRYEDVGPLDRADKRLIGEQFGPRALLIVAGNQDFDFQVLYGDNETVIVYVRVGALIGYEILDGGPPPLFAGCSQSVVVWWTYVAFMSK